MMKLLKEILSVLKNIEAVIVGTDSELEELEKQYKEYKFFADSRGMKLLADKGLVDEYNEFMSAAEEVLFVDEVPYAVKIELPKPSSKLEAFKNKFNKYF